MADLSITPANVLASAAGQKVFTFALGEACAQGDVITLDHTTSPALIYKSDSNGTSAKKTVTGLMLTAGSAGQPGVFVTLDAALAPGFTPVAGVAYYLSSNPGKICPAADLASGDKTILLGVGNDDGATLNFAPLAGGSTA